MVIVYGGAGAGKSTTTRWLVHEVKKHYGQEYVTVRSAEGEDFRSLLNDGPWTRKPIQILVIRDITHVQFSEADLRDFFRIRHRMAERTGRLEGFVLVTMEAHRFHNTPISFRSDHDSLIILSAPTDDYDARFVESKIGKEGINMLDEAELERKRGLAIFRYRRRFLGYAQIPRITQPTKHLNEIKEIPRRIWSRIRGRSLEPFFGEEEVPGEKQP
jgi:superfamily I DNA/RNA helicase